MLHYATESMAYMVAGVMDQGHKDYQALKTIENIFNINFSWKQQFQRYFLLKLPGMSLMRLSR